MGNISVLERGVIIDKLTQENFNDKSFVHKHSIKNPVLENIITEGGNDFFQYLIWTGLLKEPNLMVLSSMHHYYYDHKDMIGIRTLINLKKLNQIKHLESFLHTLYRILPPNAYFVGCFKSNNHLRNGASFNHSAKFVTGLLDIFDSKSERVLSKKGLTRIMEEYGFKVIDIMDLKGMTYFWAQNLRRSGK
jgi:hypothetical protein